MFEYILSNCRTYKEIATAITRYAKDIAVLARKFGVSVGMSYDKTRDELKIACKGKDSVSAAAIFVSIMSATVILGARQDREWRPVMARAWNYLLANQDRARSVMEQISSLQFELAKIIRKEKQKKRAPVFNMHPEFAS